MTESYFDRHPDRRPDLLYEQRFVSVGLAPVAGLDEAGRGAWAGPVTAGAVILPLDDQDALDTLGTIRDSKLLSARQRDQMYAEICAVASTWAVGHAGPDEIDQNGIVRATLSAMTRALDKLADQPNALVIDGKYMRLSELEIDQISLSKGEWKSLSIAAASILAKVTRDRYMISVASEQFPQYGFDAHKGYGTFQHRSALVEFGPCPLHRYSFRPIRQHLGDEVHV